MRVNERRSATDAAERHIASTMRAARVASGGGARRDATRATRAKPSATRQTRASNASSDDARNAKTEGVSRRTIDGSTDDDDDDDDDRHRARESRTKDARRTREG